MGKERIDWSQVECEACGNCCSNRCQYKDGNLCLAHPSIIGKEKSLRLRGKCWGGVLAQFANRVYCPPVVRIIEERLGIGVVPVSHGFGVVGIANFEEVAPVSRKLRGLD